MPVTVELDDRQLRAVALAVKSAEREQRRAIGAATQRVARPIWRRQVEARSVTALDRRVFRSAQVSRGNPPELVGAQSRRALSGGLVPAANFRWVEFGSNREHGRRGQLPRFRASGRIAYPTADRVAGALASAWATVTLAIYADALDSRGSR